MNYNFFVNQHNPLRHEISKNYTIAENKIIPLLITKAKLPPHIKEKAKLKAYEIIKQSLAYNKTTLVQQLMQEFSLSSIEGLSLMCLAESLLGIPDMPTRVALIRDKISLGNWQTHLLNSQLTLMYASSMGLNIAKKILKKPNKHMSTLSRTITKIVNRCGELIIYKSIDIAMHMMGEQFVIGQNIEQAIQASQKQAEFLYSFDMLGEAAITDQDSLKYFHQYKKAIEETGKLYVNKHQLPHDIYANNSISIKLSALHPCYHYQYSDKIMRELYPRLLELVSLAKKYNISINIDAEEAERLDLSLDLFTKLCYEPIFQNWHGLGFVVQSYQKRATYVLDYLIDLAKKSQHKIVLRLVKGAYWDNEIKYAQQEGFNDYPVFTRKNYTDISYLACANLILNNEKYIYPQFATHNALTIATILETITNINYNGLYEFQCLYGMGEQIYIELKNSIKVRKYAPIGTHTTLLPYLVRRLLENGSNSSFINQIANKHIEIETILQCPIDKTEKIIPLGASHENIPLPQNIYLPRKNSLGINLASNIERKNLEQKLNLLTEQKYIAQSILQNPQNLLINNDTYINSYNPCNLEEIIGQVNYSLPQQINIACHSAKEAYVEWSLTSLEYRAEILHNIANLFEQEQHKIKLIDLLIREAGKSLKNALAEIREAIDFLRYYAMQGLDYQNQIKAQNMHSLGLVACISPWNFPLAIFIGQISAALIGGNVVIAKPAEQTCLIAYYATILMHQAGVPIAVLQLALGKGQDIGQQIINNRLVQGVVFTGSHTVAKIIQKNLATRLDNNGKSITFIAETGGQNSMIVDSSALLQQVVKDILLSAFDSAGQRCSAVRILYIQQDIVEQTLELLTNSLQELIIGNPQTINTDIPSLIDNSSLEKTKQYLQKHNNKIIYQLPIENFIQSKGYFCPPSILKIDNLQELETEVFAPILHILTYKREELTQIITQINNLNYGLTIGIHSRVDNTIHEIINNANIGNIYINRNTIGAVVGVQPFGGEGLSGTGPKAGGQLYLTQLLQSNIHINNLIKKYYKNSAQGMILKSITGEENIYKIIPKKNILCIADNIETLQQQIDIVLHLQANPIIIKLYEPILQQLQDNKPKYKNLIKIQESIQNIQDLQVVLCNLANQNDNLMIITDIANYYEKIIPVIIPNIDTSYNLVSLFKEKTISNNIVASGGNASLMML